MYPFPAFAELIADPKIAPLILDPAPALVFGGDGKLRFANRAAISAYGAASLAELIEKSASPFGQMPETAIEFAETLPLDGPYRRETIALANDSETFRCERVALANGTSAIIFTGLARERSDGNFAKAVAALIDGERAPLAVFETDGRPVHANRMATTIMGPAGTLLHLHASAAHALQDANAKGAGEIPFGVLKIFLKKIESGAKAAIVASFTQPERPAAPAPAEEKDEPKAETPVQAPATEEKPEADLPPVIHLGPPQADEAVAETPYTKATIAADVVPPALAPEQEPEQETVQPLPPIPETPKPIPSPTPRRAPSRFVWQLDAAGKFTNISPDLVEAVGAENAAQIGETWQSLAARAGIGNTDALFAAIQRRDTWSGVSVIWPVAQSDTARPVDLAALPVFDRERNFHGYRGFGVFREAIPFIAKAKPAPAVEEPTEETAANDEFPLRHEPHEETPAVETPASEAAAVETPIAEIPEVVAEPEVKSEETPTPAAQSAEASNEGAGEQNPTPRGEPPALEIRDRIIRIRPSETDFSSLSPKEQTAFREIGRVLSREAVESDRERTLRDLSNALGIKPPLEGDGPKTHDLPLQDLAAPVVRRPADGSSERALLDRLPLGIAVHRDEKVLYANRTLFEWLGIENLELLEKNGGLARVFSGAALADDAADPTIPRTLAVQGPNGEPIPVETRLLSTPWHGQSALVYVLRRANAGFDERRETIERALRAAESATREQQAILDTATDGVLIIDRDGKIVGINKSAEALFGFDFAEIQNSSFTMLFAPESHRAAVDYLDGLASNGVASVLNDGREVVGRERQGGLIPLFMTLGKIGEDGQKFCAVLRDITQWKRAEEELTGARRQAEQASSHKSDFLAKISHEMRTPLNAIIGFAEVMMEERFGPIGNERYREYLKDIHQSGGHLISLINDLLDLSKIEAGKLELNFASVDLNDIAQQCMAIMQPQANRERIIIRTALATNLPPVVADARSIRQIVLNLLSNSVKFTKPGGQVIVSTSLTDKGEVVMRVRDTGVGMSEEDIAAALEPFRQLATSGRDQVGTGLGLPLTKALVEANRASFHIKSAVNAGTLIEVSFPSTRVLAE
jgi:PAS domain S-box-containing protein